MEEAKKQEPNIKIMKDSHILTKIILTQKQEEVEIALEKVDNQIRLYKANRYKKYLCTGCGGILGFLIAYTTIFAYNTLGFARYKRTGLDDTSKFYFGDTQFDQIYADELLTPAFDYNS